MFNLKTDVYGHERGFYIGIDPGLSRNGIVLFYNDCHENKHEIMHCDVTPLDALLPMLSFYKTLCHPKDLPVTVVIECPAPYATVPTTIMQTSFVLGFIVPKIYEEFFSYNLFLHPITRQHIKLQLLGTVKGRDSDIRIAVLERLNLDKTEARRLGLKGDAFSALAAVLAFLTPTYQITNLETEWLNLFMTVGNYTLAPKFDDSEVLQNELAEGKNQ